MSKSGLLKGCIGILNIITVDIAQIPVKRLIPITFD
jgi:hypothetical protein